jgi:uncharacterized protein (DUF488 family)
MSPDHTVYTVGYGNRPIADFLDLLSKYRIEVIGDVRSTPYSSRYPDYAREPLRVTLRDAGIKYVFLGEELGARPSDPVLYDAGRASYSAMAASAAFQRGIARVETGSSRFRLALMCAEKDPIDCHRAVLVSRELARAGARIFHIDAAGALQSQPELEARLLRLYGLDQVPLFEPERISRAVDEAYKRRGGDLAYDVDAAYRARAAQ